MTSYLTSYLICLCLDVSSAHLLQVNNSSCFACAWPLLQGHLAFSQNLTFREEYFDPGFLSGQRASPKQHERLFRDLGHFGNIGI